MKNKIITFLKFSLLVSILTTLVASGVLLYWHFSKSHTPTPPEPTNLEKFPTITDDTYTKEIEHKEIATKQDILDFELDKVDNTKAFKEQLAQITHKSTKYQLEFTEHKTVFLNNQNQEETLLNQIEVTKFETWISKPPNDESLNNTPDDWELIKKDTDSYLKITPYNRLLFLDSAGKLLKRFHTNITEDWANKQGQLAKERGNNLRNWADFTYPTNKTLLFQKFYYWQHKQDDFTYLVPVYWETREDRVEDKPTFTNHFLLNSQLLTFTQHAIPMVSSGWSNFHIVWGFPFYFRYLITQANWNDSAFRDYWLGNPTEITKHQQKYLIYVDRVIPQYIFELVQFGITMGTLSALKTTFTRVIQAQKALLAGNVEEDTWLFRGQIRSILESLGFNRYKLLPFEEALETNLETTLPSEGTLIEQADQLITNLGESLTQMFTNRWRDYITEIFSTEITQAISRANIFTASLVANLKGNLERTLKKLIISLETKMNKVVLTGTLQSLANLLGFLLFNNLYHYLVIPEN